MEYMPQFFVKFVVVGMYGIEIFPGPVDEYHFLGVGGVGQGVNFEAVSPHLRGVIGLSVF